MWIFLPRSDGITCLVSQSEVCMSMRGNARFATYRVVLAGFLRIVPLLELVQASVASVPRIVGILGLVQASVAPVNKLSRDRCAADEFDGGAIKIRAENAGIG